MFYFYQKGIGTQLKYFTSTDFHLFHLKYLFECRVSFQSGDPSGLEIQWTLVITDFDSKKKDFDHSGDSPQT